MESPRPRTLVRFDHKQRQGMQAHELANLFLDLYENHWHEKQFNDLKNHVAIQLCVIKGMSVFFDIDPQDRGFSAQAFEFADSVRDSDDDLYLLFTDYWNQMCRVIGKRCTNQKFESIKEMLDWKPQTLKEFLSDCSSDSLSSKTLELIDFLEDDECHDVKVVLNRANEISQLADQLIEANCKELAFHLMGAFVMNQTIIESDYGSPDGFWLEHEDMSAKLFQLAMNLELELLDNFRVTPYFAGALGMSLNPSWNVLDLDWIAADIERIDFGWEDEECAMIWAAVVFNESNTYGSVQAIVNRFELETARALCGLITNVLPKYGDYAEHPQRLIAQMPISNDIRNALVDFFTDNGKDKFNEFVNWKDLEFSREEILAAIKSRAA